MPIQKKPLNMTKNVIYIFTCNRPVKLEKLVHEVCSIKEGCSVYIIDDSCKGDNINMNQRITKSCNKAKYLGASQYLDFYKPKSKLSNGQLLGDETWNLGIARNFALDHSTLWGYDKALFIDDDISEINERKIEDGFSALTDHNFVSCTLKGVKDDSIVGRIAKEVGVIDDGQKMLSGGFLFLSPTSISHRFFNIYNEDWILQLLEKEKEQIVLPYTVRHDADQNCTWTLDQVIFQEFGELVVEGLLENSNALSLNHSFWGNILKSRIQFIEEILEYSINERSQHGQSICKGVLNWLNQQSGFYLLKSIEQIKSEQYEYKV